MSAGAVVWTPAYVALGSNLDDPAAQVQAAYRALAGWSGVAAPRLSPLYRSTPLGGLSQPDYCNAVAGLLTTLSAERLLASLLEIEKHRGRTRGGERWGPRRIDLDLLVFGTQQSNAADLTLPHPGIVSRNFVLYPLADIAPTLDIPGLGVVNRLRDAVGGDGLKRMS